MALAITLTTPALAYENRIGINSWPEAMQTAFVNTCVARVGMNPNVRRLYKFEQVQDTCRCVKDYLMYNYEQDTFTQRMSNYNPEFSNEVQYATKSCLGVLGYSKEVPSNT